MDIVEYADYIEAGYTSKQIQEMKGYSDRKWRKTLISLGIITKKKSKKKLKPITKANTRWTDEEKEFLKENVRYMTHADIAAELGRTPKAVEMMCVKIGAKKYNI